MCEISIVIANYNYGRFLETAIKSVVEQEGFSRCELIIIDGGSSDNSLDVIRKYSSKIAYWISENDSGQSDAFNKGFNVAKGRIGCWLNADDILLPGTLKTVLAVITNHPSVEWITGGVIFFNNDLRIWKMRRGTWVTKGMHRWVDATVIGGPSSFFSIQRLRAVGGFDVSLHYSMDCDLWKKFFSAGMMMHHVNHYFWGFRMHKDSKTADALIGGDNCVAMREAERHCASRRFSKNAIAMHVFLLRLFKIVNGSLILSMFDTLYYYGDNILKFGRRG